MAPGDESGISAALKDISVVVFARDHNPSLLNQDFLRIQGIVPEDWHLELEEPVIVTPPLSRVEYANGLVITVERGKMEASAPAVTDGSDESQALHVARQFVRILPHIRYTGIALTFISEARIANPLEFMITRYVKGDFWRQAGKNLDGLGIRFSYESPERSLYFGLDGDESEEEPTLVAVGHIHHDWDDGYPTHEKALAALAAFDEDFAVYMDLLSDVWPTEAAHGS